MDENTDEKTRARAKEIIPLNSLPDAGSEPEDAYYRPPFDQMAGDGFPPYPTTDGRYYLGVDISGDNRTKVWVMPATCDES